MPILEMTREADRDLEVDVLALQALSPPSDLAGEIWRGDGASCGFLSRCCQSCVCTVGTRGCLILSGI